MMFMPGHTFIGAAHDEEIEDCPVCSPAAGTPVDQTIIAARDALLEREYASEDKFRDAMVKYILHREILLARQMWAALVHAAPWLKTFAVLPTRRWRWSGEVPLNWYAHAVYTRDPDRLTDWFRTDEDRLIIFTQHARRSYEFKSVIPHERLCDVVFAV